MVEEDPMANVEFRSIGRPTEEYLLGKLHLPIPPLRLERPVRHTFLFQTMTIQYVLSETHRKINQQDY